MIKIFFGWLIGTIIGMSLSVTIIPLLHLNSDLSGALAFLFGLVFSCLGVIAGIIGTKYD